MYAFVNKEAKAWFVKLLDKASRFFSPNGNALKKNQKVVLNRYSFLSQSYNKSKPRKITADKLSEN